MKDILSLLSPEAMLAWARTQVDKSYGYHFLCCETCACGYYSRDIGMYSSWKSTHLTGPSRSAVKAAWVRLNVLAARADARRRHLRSRSEPTPWSDLIEVLEEELAA